MEERKENEVTAIMGTDIAFWYRLMPDVAAVEMTMGGIGEYAASEKDGLEKYLTKEEKIYSLLRKKQSKPFRKSQVLEGIKKSWDKTLDFLTVRLGKELKERFLQIESEAGMDEACEWLQREFICIPGLSIESTTDEYVKRMMKSCGTKEEFYHMVRIRVPGWKEFFSAVESGVQKKYDRFNYGFRGENRYICLADFQRLITELYVRNYMLQYFCDLREECGTMREYFNTRLVCRVAREYFKEGLLDGFSEEVLNLREMPYVTVPDEFSEKKGIYRLIMDNQHPEDVVNMISSSDCQEILKLMKAEYLQRKEEAKMEKNLSGEYAKSYETKRNIPEKYLRAMARSGFNNYYGYVEYDEDCDLDLLPELYREYQALCEVVGIPAYKDASLRFRKLGNHHASGLYYPTLACLCVDLRYPQSMAHEVGHMIDYHCDHISEKRDFMDVFDRYSFLLRRVADNTQDVNLKKKLRSSGKYNLSYYLQSTEIFARCFEMYLVRTMKVNNSLCRPEAGFAYPEDEQLDRACEEFFSALLEQLKGEKEDGKEGREVSEDSVLQPVSNNQ